MGSDVNQRHIVTSRLKLEDEEPAFGATNPDDEATDSSLARIDPVNPFPEENAGAPEPAPEGESPWRLNALGTVLLTAFVCTLIIAVALRVKLSQTHAALLEAESAAEAAESAVAREPSAPDERAAGTPALARAVVKPEPSAPADSPDRASAEAPQHEQLLLLLTVGTEHFAEKQLRNLQRRCRAPLVVYRQKRGRCAFSQCFAVATPSSQAEAARGCGLAKGQTLRDRDDFAAP